MADVQDCDECGATTRGKLCRRCNDRDVTLKKSVAEAIRYKEQEGNDE